MLSVHVCVWFFVCVTCWSVASVDLQILVVTNWFMLTLQCVQEVFSYLLLS